MGRVISHFLSWIIVVLFAGLCGRAWAEAVTNAAKYAPDRKVVIEHLALDITPDFTKRTIAGSATFTFKPIGSALEELRLDAVDLNIAKVTCSEELAGHHVTEKEILITFAHALAHGKQATLTIEYSAQPTKGLYFRVPSNGYLANESHLWTQGESIDSRYWFPCYDAPNLKYTSEITCHVPEGMKVISNGREMSQTKDAKTGLVAVRWLQDKPHVSYLLSLVAGPFVVLEDHHGKIPLRFYALPGDAAEAPLTFAGTHEAMEFFEHDTGVPFPWAQYGQVVVRDFVAGGMENTTLATLMDWTLHRSDTESITSSENLVAHELAHQWFGDYVTCKDWSHVWLNEGFATYYALLFAGHQHGRDELLYGLFRDAQRITSQNPSQPRPIVFRYFNEPGEQFDYRAYGKGGWVVHMLRCQLGEELYHRCIQTYLQRRAFNTVVTEDLNTVIEEFSGRSFDRFFDQWVYHAGQPELDINYTWDRKTQLARISVRQIQAINEQVMLFEFPLTIRLVTKTGKIDHRVQVNQKDHEFFVPCAEEPVIVRIDPNLELLAKINFKPPTPMLYAQLVDAKDVVGRLIAAELLAANNDAATVAKLKDVLCADAYWGVRHRASASLLQIHTDESLEALCASTQQSDARVRNAVIGDIAHFYHPRAAEALNHCLSTEHNPAILATAIRGLAPYRQQRAMLLQYLGSDSYRSQIAGAAIEALRTQDDPASVSPLREALAANETIYASHVFGGGLEALGWLSRNEKSSRENVREFLARYLNHPRQNLQLAAMRALGALEDPQSIVLLETFTASAKSTPQKQTAEQAIAALRAVNKPADNLSDLRGQVLDLPKQIREARSGLDELKKQFEAVGSASTLSKQSTTAPATSPASQPSEPSTQPDHASKP